MLADFFLLFILLVKRGGSTVVLIFCHPLLYRERESACAVVTVRRAAADQVPEEPGSTPRGMCVQCELWETRLFNLDLAL